jgi:uracil-DNA glycosylase
MHNRTIKQDTIGNRLRGTSLFQNYHTGNDGTGTNWEGCTGCKLHYGRTRVCVRYDGTRFWRQERPVRLLFIGEAPGATENATGVPFTGTTGRVLDVLFEYTRTAFKVCLTNLVCCQTKDTIEIDFGQIDSPDHDIKGDLEFTNYGRQPTKKEMSACRSHIDELISSFHPEGLVYIGSYARDNYAPIRKLPTHHFPHPSFILREHEFRLIPVKQEAKKLQKFIQNLRETNA